MSSAAIIACVFNSLLGAVLPGPAEGRTEFRYTEAHCSLTPSVVKPGEETTLTVRLTPRAGATWHEARLVPSRVEIRPPKGWTVQESDLALPAPESPGGPREFTVRLTPRADEERGGQWGRAAEGTGGEVLELRICYGVRLDFGPPGETGSRAAGPSEKAAVSPGVISPEVIFEEATLAVELPAVLLAASLPTADSGNRGGKGPGLPGGVAALPEAEGLDDERGSPLLPALFFALATAMVFAGLALWVRRRNSPR